MRYKLKVYKIQNHTEVVPPRGFPSCHHVQTSPSSLEYIQVTEQTLRSTVVWGLGQLGEQTSIS